MSQAITIPKLGLTMEDATVVEWARSDGEQVRRGDVVITIETDKIMFDVEAEHDGYLQRVAAIGDVLQIAAVVGHLHESAEAALSAAAGGTPAATGALSAASIAATPQAAPTPDAPAIASGSNLANHPASLAVPVDASGRRLMVSPVARQIAAVKKLDLHSIAGSGPGGVILKRDVEAAPARSVAPAAAIATATNTAPAPAQTRRPLSGMRLTIAQRMLHSLATKAQMTGFGRVDMAEAMKMRETLVAAQAELGARITYTDLVLKAAATVLVAMPEVSAYIDGNEIVSCSEVHIGLAVALDGGLIVPVIRHVDRLSLVELSLARQALIDKARAGKLSREDVEGGSFTVSNFGSYGGDFETPILNAPQSALLGIGQITDEAVVRDKQIVIRPMMSISLTFDHALIDGSVAGEFRARFKAMLERPALMLARLR
jgi:pyruvate dehydrogenase E2 component (dihydrolipoamide acetyltransferase)